MLKNIASYVAFTNLLTKNLIIQIRKKMLFHLDFRVEYSAEMSQNDFFDIWSEEATAAVGAKKAGVVVDLWKAVGDRRVIAIVNVESMEMLDQILLDSTHNETHGSACKSRRYCLKNL